MADSDPIQRRLDGMLEAVHWAGGHLTDISSPLMAAMTDEWTLDVRKSFIRIVLSGVRETLLPKALILKFVEAEDVRVPLIVSSTYFVGTIPSGMLSAIIPEY